jgi:pilus assembly protein Flp/PilA
MLYTPREEGQGLLEYAMILILVAIVVFLVIVVLGPTVGNLYSNVMNNI